MSSGNVIHTHPNPNRQFRLRLWCNGVGTMCDPTYHPTQADAMTMVSACKSRKKAWQIDRFFTMCDNLPVYHLFDESH